MGQKPEKNDWKEAVGLICRYSSNRWHLDDLLETAELPHSRWLVMEVFRQWFAVNHLLDPLLKRRPRPVCMGILRLAITECLIRETEVHPRIVDHAVESGKMLRLAQREVGFINGVLRGLLREGRMNEVPLESSHPKWLVERWEHQFGEKQTRALLRWNQAVPHLTIQAEDCPSYAQKTQWPGYFISGPGFRPELEADLEAGCVYMQDPFARIPVKLLAARPGEAVLDLCAAPGGKTRLLARALEGKGRLIAVDKPGWRLQRLESNLRAYPSEFLQIIGCSIEELLSQAGEFRLEPGTMDAVLIDVPCSNTGVIRKRPDVKIRLSEDSISELAACQSLLLENASDWVRGGGRLVYSTCSLESEENQQVVDQFMENHPGWVLADSVLSYPWECGHDGGGAFLLTNGTGQ